MNVAMRWTRLLTTIEERRLHHRAGQWSRMLSAFLTVQTLNQILALGTGLLLVRTASKETFALYAIASSVLTFFTTASDLGVTGSLVHFFHQEKKGAGSFTAALHAVGQLRRWALLIGSPIAALVFLGMAGRQGFHGAVAALCAAALVVGVAVQISASLGLQRLRLTDGLRRSYQAELSGNSLRLILTGGLAVGGLLTPLLGAPAAVAVSVLGTAATAWIARQRSASPRPARADIIEARRKVIAYLTPSLPSGLYFSIQGPLIIWLAATFGSTTQLADVGALGRLGLLVSVLSPLPGVILLPRLAHVTDETLFWRRAVQFGFLFAGLLAPFVLVSWLYPQAFLSLLGRHYAGLGPELPLAMAGAAVGVFGGYLVGLTRARGYTRWDTAALLCLIAAQAVLAALLPLATVRGVLAFGLGSGIAGALLQAGIATLGRRREAATA